MSDLSRGAIPYGIASPRVLLCLLGIDERAIGLQQPFCKQ